MGTVLTNPQTVVSIPLMKVQHQKNRKFSDISFDRYSQHEAVMLILMSTSVIKLS